MLNKDRVDCSAKVFYGKGALIATGFRIFGGVKYNARLLLFKAYYDASF
ncbi:hypothetical protein PPBDW_I22157 [Photobacterium kishitanii]|nr:hypothetical protein PPBDW_I22157 [Photobacterium kishitanii]